jgi:hypothetical protein
MFQPRQYMTLEFGIPALLIQSTTSEPLALRNLSWVWERLPSGGGSRDGFSSTTRCEDPWDSDQLLGIGRWELRFFRLAVS